MRSVVQALLPFVEVQALTEAQILTIFVQAHGKRGSAAYKDDYRRLARAMAKRSVSKSDLEKFLELKDSVFGRMVAELEEHERSSNDGKQREGEGGDEAEETIVTSPSSAEVGPVKDLDGADLDASAGISNPAAFNLENQACGKVATPRELVEALQAGVDVMAHFRQPGGNDGEAARFLRESSIGSLWQRAFEEGDDFVNSVEATCLHETEQLGADAKQVCQDFLGQYRAATGLWATNETGLPEGYDFRDSSGNLRGPLLMQRLFVVQATDPQRYGFGNWSSPGAGKTLSTILAWNELDGDCLAIVPLPIVPQMAAEVERCFPGKFRVFERSAVLEPCNWEPAGRRTIYILNIQILQTSGKLPKLVGLMETHGARFHALVIDELHQVKARKQAKESLRRGACLKLAAALKGANNGAKIWGLSGTPVVNDYTEAISLLDLVNPAAAEKVRDSQEVDFFGRCLMVHQQLTLNGAFTNLFPLLKLLACRRHYCMVCQASVQRHLIVELLAALLTFLSLATFHCNVLQWFQLQA